MEAGRLSVKRSAMKPRRKYLARSAGIGSGTRKPLKARNPKRRASEFARTYESKERVAWIKAQRSVASGRGPCENVHVKGGGASRKADACWIVPLTRSEHVELHQHGVTWFEARYGLSLEFMAAQTHTAWLAYPNRTTA